MASKLFIKRIQNEIKIYSKDNFTFPNLILRPSNDLSIWYFLIYDLKDTPFENGVYLGEIKIPEKYPIIPPDFKLITPNGRLSPGTVICTSFSKYHKESYTCVWNILTMTQGMISFMTEHGSGIGSITTSDNIKIDLANNSLKWNLNNDLFKSHFPDYKKLLNL